MLGQRPADATLPEPPTPGLAPVSMCSGESAFAASEGRSWSAVSTAATDLPKEFATPVTALSQTLAATVVLDDSPSAVRSMDERLQSWATCPAPAGRARKAQVLEVTGAGAAVGFHTTAEDRPVSARYSYTAVARVQNLLLACDARGPREAATRSTAMSCLSTMSQGVAIIERPLQANADDDQLAAKVVLSGLVDRRWELSPRDGTWSSPCPSATERPFLIRTAASVQLDHADAGAGPRRALAMVSAELFATPAAARAKVAGLRRHLADCDRSWVQSPRDFPAAARITSIGRNQIGDGGVSVTWQLTPSGSTPLHQAETVFSTGRLVVHVRTLDAASGKHAAATQAAVAAAVLKRVDSLS